MTDYTDLCFRLVPVKSEDALSELAMRLATEEAFSQQFMEQRDAALARVKRLEDALRGLLAFEPEHCPCGEGSCLESKDGWGNARATLAEGDKP